MRMKTTTWWPTVAGRACGCVINKLWDADSKEEGRKHTVHPVSINGEHKTQHCGGSHPPVIVGETLEESEFYKDYLHRKQLAEKLGGNFS